MTHCAIKVKDLITRLENVNQEAFVGITYIIYLKNGTEIKVLGLVSDVSLEIRDLHDRDDLVVLQA